MDKRKKANKYLKKLKDGKTNVFDAFFCAFYGHIHDVAFMELNDKTHADDVTESTFEVVINSIQDFDEEKSGYAWLVGIAKNIARKINRDEYKYELTDNAEEIADELYSDGFEFDGEGNYNVVQAMSKLDPLNRKIVRLKLYEDKTIADIARILGMDYMAVYNRFQTSLEKLEKFLKKP